MKKGRGQKSELRKINLKGMLPSSNLVNGKGSSMKSIMPISHAEKQSMKSINMAHGSIVRYTTSPVLNNHDFVTSAVEKQAVSD